MLPRWISGGRRVESEVVVSSRQRVEVVQAGRASNEPTRGTSKSNISNAKYQKKHMVYP